MVEVREVKIVYDGSYKPRGSTLAMIEQANAICEDYAAQGYDLTLRQLFYQFVSRGLIPNQQREYKRLGDVLNKGRLAGYVDWSHIVDRTRNLRANSHWSTPSDMVDAAASSYALDKWIGQDVRVEVWVEKEALAGVVQQSASRFDCAWFSCRGYVSQSELWGAARRHLRYLKRGQRVVVVHLGDHDPSGIDMTRDITDRLETFIVQDWANDMMDDWEGKLNQLDVLDNLAERLGGYEPVKINRIALNMPQIEEFNPPPNPAKLTDSRSSSYVQNFGYESWELDALDPATLDRLITDAITAEVDLDLYEEREQQQEEERAILNQASRRWPEIRQFLEDNPEN
jgi:hypothetical protein